MSHEAKFVIFNQQVKTVDVPVDSLKEKLVSSSIVWKGGSSI